MFLRKVEQIQVAVERAFNGFSAMIIALMMFLTTVDVVLRYIFNSPIPGVYTLSRDVHDRCRIPGCCLRAAKERSCAGRYLDR